MSQNKTIVPGMAGGPFSDRRDGNAFYSRDAISSGKQHKGTIVTGMEQCAPGVTLNPSTEQNVSPVIGFLYTISRQGIGEYWPLHIGSNLIGSSTDCDICLKEKTVSGNHAALVVRKMKNTDKVIASIKDDSSKNGTLVNGDDIGFGGHECFNGDIITIGSGYEMLLILVDARALGLRVSENFIPMEEEDNEPFGNPVVDYNNFNPYDHNSRPTQGGTIAMDGSNPITSGGTEFM